jgi:beta-xylosidase
MNHPSVEASGVNVPDQEARLIKPLFHNEMKDISVCRGGDDAYYLTATLLDHPRTGIHLWRSTDLQEWNELGEVFTSELRFEAPEIHFLNASYYIVLAEPAGCVRILVSDSGPKGPYKSSGCLLENATDPSLFLDKDSTLYLMYGNGYIVKLKNDLSGVEGEPVFLRPDPSILNPDNMPRGRDWPVVNRVGKSGVFLTIIKDKYYLFASEITGRMLSTTEDVFVSVAEKLLGPYGPRYLTVPHASQTTVFKGPGNDLYATYSGHAADHYAAFRERPGIVPLEFSGSGMLRPSSEVIVERSVTSGYQMVLPSETMRDPSVTMDEEGNYYVVGTLDGYGYTYGNGGVKAWKSRNLREWEEVGFIWQWTGLGKEYTDRTKLWAPEIKYVKQDKTFYITFSIWTGTGVSYLFRSTTGQVEGPYENVTDQHLVRGIDGFLYEEGEHLYFLWGGGRLGELNEDRSGFVEEPVRLLTAENRHVGYEGNCLVKVEDTYVLTGAEWNGPLRMEGTYDMMCGISKELFGPYTPAKVSVPHAGHGTVFQDQTGNWYTTIFGNDRTAPWRMHFGLIPIKWQEDIFVPVEK